MTNLKKMATIDSLNPEFEEQIIKHLKAQGYLIAKDGSDTIIVYKKEE